MIKTYAPKGQTPVIRQKITRDHLSAIGGMTPAGKVYTLARQESLNGLHSIEVLEHLLRAAGERLLVIWDGSPIHRRVAVTEFVTGTGGRIWLEALPAYAPDLNSWDEGGWHELQDVEMGNVVCRDLRRVARAIPPRRRPSATKASPGSILLRPGRFDHRGNLIVFAQRSVDARHHAEEVLHRERDARPVMCRRSRPGAEKLSSLRNAL